MRLSLRQQLVIYAALNFAQCNADDVNDAFACEDTDDEIKIGGMPTAPFNSEEFLAVTHLFDPSKGVDVSV